MNNNVVNIDVETRRQTFRDSAKPYAKTEQSGLQKDYEAWCLGKDAAKSPTLEMRKRTGTVSIFPYPYLQADYNPSKGIRLIFGGERVVIIKGRNLELLKGHLSAYNVVSIAESPEFYRAGEAEPCIEEIQLPEEDEDW